MGIPSQERLENLCRNDMDAIEREVASIRAAMKKVDAMMENTWVGKNADDWRTDYEARIRRLKRLFGTFDAEEKRLVEKARDKQENQDKKSHGA